MAVVVKMLVLVVKPENLKTGLDEIKLDKDGNMTSVGNEYHLLKWCELHNELPPYKVFNKQPFDGNFSTDIELLDTKWYTGDIDYSNTDIVLSVPVCSGLSSATIANEQSKMKKNCNMLWNETSCIGNRRRSGQQPN